MYFNFLLALILILIIGFIYFSNVNKEDYQLSEIPTNIIPLSPGSIDLSRGERPLLPTSIPLSPGSIDLSRGERPLFPNPNYIVNLSDNCTVVEFNTNEPVLQNLKIQGSQTNCIQDPLAFFINSSFKNNYNNSDNSYYFDLQMIKKDILHILPNPNYRYEFLDTSMLKVVTKNNYLDSPLIGIMNRSKPVLDKYIQKIRIQLYIRYVNKVNNNSELKINTIKFSTKSGINIDAYIINT